MPTTNTRNRAALALVLLLGGLAAGTAYLMRPDSRDPGHIVGGWLADTGIVPTECGFWTVRSTDPATWAQFGLELPDGGNEIAIAKSCYAVPPECQDAGADDPACAVEAQALPPGVEWLDDYTRPFIPGEPVFEVWVASHPEAPWRCSCLGTGDAAVPMPCVSWAGGGNPMPPACCEDEWAEQECGAGKCGNVRWCPATNDAGQPLECFGQACRVPPGLDAGELLPEAQVP
jgi:hypothetical protein